MDVGTRNRAAELTKELDGLFRRYGTKSVPPAIRDRIVSLNRELDGLVGDGELGQISRQAERMSNYLNKPVGGFVHPSGGSGASGSAWTRREDYAGKSLGELFVESDAFRRFDPATKSSPSANLELKAVLNTTGWAPQSIREPRVEPQPFRALRVLDAFGVGETTQNAVTYMEETTATNAAAETAESADKPESTLAFTERTSPVRTIATVLPVTNQLLEDVGAARDYIDQRLAFFVNHRLDGQLVNGDGVAPNLTGILNVSGIQTQAKGTDPVPDAILKAMDKIRATAFYEPDAVILHPNDWQEIRLLRTADGLYIFGHPADIGPERIWGIPVIATTAIAEGTGLVGAFKTAAMAFFREDMSIAVSDSHSDFFIKNQVMIRAEIRVALATFRATAFCSVTGI